MDESRTQKAECRNSLWAAPLHDRTVPFYKLMAETKLALLVKIELENDRVPTSLPCAAPAISATEFGAQV